MTTISISLKGVEMDVKFEFYEGDAGVNTYSNGDPGCPPMGDEYYINSVKIGGVDATELAAEFFEEEIYNEILKIREENLN